MSGCGCDSVCNMAPPDPRYRRALWIALEVNTLMFGFELVAGFQAQSASRRCCMRIARATRRRVQFGCARATMPSAIWR